MSEPTMSTPIDAAGEPEPPAASGGGLQAKAGPAPPTASGGGLQAKA